MAQINPCFNQLQREYIFPVIENKLSELSLHVNRSDIINLGIGDIALPIAPAIIAAICLATQEMGTPSGIKGYGPSNGYLFLRELIAQHEFAHLGIDPDEIFISDGANSDTVHIQELFDTSSVVGITDPTYPAYLDANRLAGKQIITLPCLEENSFCPLPPQEHCDLIYLCSPNNPTGIAMTHDQLTLWVEYALREQAILLFDNAYEAFITSPDVPHSIFEIEGAKKCAIEFRSFSKSAGFTGLRCAYTILPRSVRGIFNDQPQSVHHRWSQYLSITFNGVAYPIQKGAAAIYSEMGRLQTQQQIQHYLHAAQRLSHGLRQMGLICYGGINAPYVWVKTPKNLSSWQFFDYLLEKCHLITIPGNGFGKHGEGFVRFSTFSQDKEMTTVLQRLQTQCILG